MAKFGHTISMLQQIMCCSWIRFLDRETMIWLQSNGSNEKPRGEHRDMEYIYVCHSSSCSSSRERLHRKSGIYQESLLEIFETFSSDWEVDHRSDRRYCTDHDWLAAVYVERRLWLTELFNLQLLKPTSFLTQCCVWEVSVTNQSKRVKAGSNGSWKHVMSKIRIGSTQNKWSSSGQISQDSPDWEFSTRFKRWWLNYSVNQSNSKEVSSSCHSTLTLIGENEETKKIVFRMLSELLSMLEDSRKDIGRCLDLVPRKNGTEHMSTNRMDSGIKLLKAWCSTLPKADIPYSVLRRKWWNRWIDSSHWFFRQSALCLRSSGRFV